MRYTEPFKNSYEIAHDSFLHWQFAVIPCVVAAIITSIVQNGFTIYDFDFIDVSVSTDSLTVSCISSCVLNCPFYFIRLYTCINFIHYIVFLEFLSVPGSPGDRTPADRAAAVQGGGEPHRPLRLLPGGIQTAVYVELGIPQLSRG